MRLLLQTTGNNQADTAPEENVGKYVGIALGVAGGVILVVGFLVFLHRRYGTPLRQCCLGGIVSAIASLSWPGTVPSVSQSR